MAGPLNSERTLLGTLDQQSDTTPVDVLNTVGADASASADGFAAMIHLGFDVTAGLDRLLLLIVPLLP